jgi:glutamate-1-semialdehyde 2,1-aminomutase
MTSGTSQRVIDRPRIRSLIERERLRLDERTTAARDAYARAAAVLPGGVASSFQMCEPWPVYLRHAEGPAVWDVDGAQRLDFHNGFGAMVQGHAHPAIVRAVSERAAEGTHFAAPSEDATVVAGELARRFGLPKWRYTNSGTESTLDAIRIARGFTGRDAVIKMIGAYHGHHDGVMVAVDGDRDRYGRGIPDVVAGLTSAVPFNDADALERKIAALDRGGRPAACAIIEPALMLGMVLPEPGYLEAVREITRRYGVVLIFDEVKTGLSIAAGGAVERFGVQPDVVTLAKALGGGLPSGAIGGADEIMEVVENRSVHQAGTFNGNALSMAAARASLMEVLTPGAYVHLERLGERMVAGCRRALEERDLPGYAIALGARGCATLSPVPIVDGATLWASEDRDLVQLHWLFNMNRGILSAPARPEQWTLSVVHSDEDVDAYLLVFREMLTELTSGE